VTLSPSDIVAISASIPAIISSVTALIVAFKTHTSAAKANVTANVAKDVAIQALTVTNGNIQNTDAKSV
jgi:hypothetical protein